MNGDVGSCGLCREVRDLRESHLLPAALYTLARDPSRTNPNPVFLAGGRATTTSRQIKRRFLCGECEERFSDYGERYILSHCARPEEFRLRGLLEKSRPVGEVPPIVVYEVEELLGSHVDEYLYFAASVFWRASAWPWERDRPRKPFSLGGEYEEEFRLYLLGSADFPRNGRLVVHVWNDTISADAATGYVTLAPCTSRTEDGERRHKFCIPGITFVLFLGSRVPDVHDGGALNSTRGKFMWLTPFANDSLFRGAHDLVRQSRPSPSLIRSTLGTLTTVPREWKRPGDR